MSPYSIFDSYDRHAGGPPTTSSGAPAAITIADASFSWGDDSTLFDINVQVPMGSLVAVVGGTGQGKSSLISAMLGEMSPVHGSAVIHKQAQKLTDGLLSANSPSSGPLKKPSVAYVPQLAWIFNGTVRDNIIFGMPYDERRYLEARRLRRPCGQIAAERFAPLVHVLHFRTVRVRHVERRLSDLLVGNRDVEPIAEGA